MTGDPALRGDRPGRAAGHRSYSTVLPGRSFSQLHQDRPCTRKLSEQGQHRGGSVDADEIHASGSAVTEAAGNSAVTRQALHSWLARHAAGGLEASGLQSPFSED